ncbi:MAG TPA: serine hydrolase [Vicinamibacteria bacterium]|nr:serine hydrolase [Vicinamibacteria bacterium]
MSKRISITLLTAVFAPAAVFAQAYFPERHNWETRAPEQMGLNGARLEEAIDFAIAHESQAPRDLALNHELSGFAKEPFAERIGPTTVRAPLNGLILRNGYIVAEWGDTNQVDMTFSVTKTFLSTVVGLAWDRGLIADLNDFAFEYMPTQELFEGEHNKRITWEHLLRQTSDWEGTLFGKPDWADRPVGENPSDYPNRPKYEPGTHYKYNDVRVNLLALVALNVWRRPLPQVLREQVMDPIGASNTWRWHGYENSWVTIDGQQMQSVSGGGHWGGGMHISARDMARFGYLFLRYGTWAGERIISEEWIAMARKPGVNPTYGFMNWFLNLPYTTDEGEKRKPVPAAPDGSVTFRGAGSNIIYIDWDNDLVVVVRWIGEGFNEFIQKTLDSIEAPAPTENAARSR